MEGEKRVTRSMTRNLQRRDWSQMKPDILVQIFSTFHIIDLIMNVSRASHAWYSACTDPSIWKNKHILDLSILDRYYAIPPNEAAWEDETSSRTYSRILRDAFDLSRGTITKLIFHYQIRINDEHLNLVANRCPRLKHLVLPQYHRLSLDALQRCLTVWGSTLESLMVPEINIPNDLVKVLGQCCPNLKALKFMTELNERVATSIVKYLPSLKQLSIRGTTIRKKPLEFLMNEMKNLEALNITHSLIIHWPQLGSVICFSSDINDIIKETTRRPPTFLTCHIDMCEDCGDKYYDGECDELEHCWCEYREDVWRVDEIASLSY